MSFSLAQTTLQHLHTLGARLLIIEGGEPFFWKDDGYALGDIVRAAHKLFYHVGVTTNGTFPLDVDASTIWVSIDGLRETHDRLRGESFDRALAHIRCSPHPRVFAHITINALNWREIPSLVRYLADDVRAITFQFHYPYGNVSQDLVLPFGKRRVVLDELARLKRRGLPIADSNACFKALKTNRWKCQPWMIASADPDGSCTQGCYLQKRGEISCEQCGFSAHVEISLAYSGVISAIVAGARIFH